MENKITICITYYNQKDFVKKSIESALAIDFPCDFEILCGDDGSNDGTLDVIKEYAQKYPQHVRYFVMERNETSKSINRASQNRLNLLSQATGNYIMFLDGDDFYCNTDFLKKAVDIFQTDSNTEACAFNYKYVYEDGREEMALSDVPVGIIKSEDYIQNGIYIHSGAFVFKNNLNEQQIELLKKINNFDDNAITLYMLQFGNLYYFDQPIYAYRQTNDSLWSDANECERHLLNALDYKMICDSNPRFTREIAHRQYMPMKYLYKNKKFLMQKLSNKYDKYISIAQHHQDILVLNLLKWNSIHIIQKIKTIFLWKKFKKMATFSKR